MSSISKNLLSQLTSEEAVGPFVTFMLNTHVSHQEVEKDQLMLKNFAKEAKKRFEKRYPDEKFAPFQEKIDRLLTDLSFWRSPTASVAIILTKDETYIHRLSIEVDDQYYVADLPYLLAIIKNAQFNYNYLLLALNRDSMKLYQMKNKQLSEVTLPEEAPTDATKALGDELADKSRVNTSGAGSADGLSFHGMSPKDEEVEVDWLNYYQAVDNFLRGLANPEQLPLYLFALPENQSQFKKVAKINYYSDKAAISASPANLSIKDIELGALKLSDELAELETTSYQKLTDKKFNDQLVDIDLAAKDARISHLFIATSNLIPGFGDDPDTEYDRRQVLNQIAELVISGGGQVFVLDQKAIPDEKSLLAILRY
ncbi:MULTISPECIES: baeRF6 domain-containing protein [Enterococcus]|uniref:Bacterial archaeo-eukaryotic release factor family 6 domain-containing protein n=1 Tax=Enterococcus alishanensis TaxID=1303817 RepID=A0ABS6T8S5_9ENTE|nr:hypothetical protein [Enterococcus alishanensis]MBV7389296.1 hypothetical protein [Enterococcus alishanensis]